MCSVLGRLLQVRQSQKKLREVRETRAQLKNKKQLENTQYFNVYLADAAEKIRDHDHNIRPQSEVLETQRALECGETTIE